jgi:peptidoglycan/LPS O-acetylase OafA/YrhL
LVGIFLWSYFSRIDPGNGLLDKGAGAACLVVGALLLEASCRRPLEADRPGACLSIFLWIGSISYPLYLVHAGIAERLLRFVCSILLGAKVDGISGFVALTLTSLVLAWAAHVFLERRFIGAGKQFIGWKNKADV